MITGTGTTATDPPVRRGASHTAIGVARCVLAAARLPLVASSLPDGCADATRDLLRATSAARRVGVAFMERPLYSRFAARLDERGPLPGILRYLALRKRWFDDEVCAALRAGATQVVILGAGLDTLAMRRCSDFPRVRFVELDHPATQRVKRRALAARGDRPNLHLVSVDLAVGSAIDDALAGSGFDPKARTVLVAEGLLMYLPADTVDRVLAFAGRIAPGSVLLFSFVHRREDGRVDAGPGGAWMSTLLRLFGEPLRSGFAPGTLDGILATHHLDLGCELGAAELRDRYLPDLPPPPPLEWERVGVARRTE